MKASGPASPTKPASAGFFIPIVVVARPSGLSCNNP